jgi:hypothetical protein
LAGDHVASLYRYTSSFNFVIKHDVYVWKLIWLNQRHGTWCLFRRSACCSSDIAWYRLEFALLQSRHSGRTCTAARVPTDLGRLKVRHLD